MSRPSIPAPPPKPKAVQGYERENREWRLNVLFFMCRRKARWPFPHDAHVEGSLIADNVLNQIMQQMRERQSKIVVPQPGMLVPR